MAIILSNKKVFSFFRNSFFQKRFLNLFEDQSKDLLHRYGVNTQRFRIINHPSQVENALKSLNAFQYVIKAQVLAGGRGKGIFSSGLHGGVHVIDAKDSHRILPLATQMIGHQLFTNQTGSSGVRVDRVMIAEALDIVKETYFAIILDRLSNGIIIVGSMEGGVDIEEVSRKNPERVFSLKISNPKEGPTDEELTLLAKSLCFPFPSSAVYQMKQLYRLFVENDATQVEINPFGVTLDGKVVCFDAKINLDENASFRHPEWSLIMPTTNTLVQNELDMLEIEAQQYGFSYVEMNNGSLACLVNGAGLAMATVDILKLSKGNPRNFLDIGGNATKNQIKEAFKLATRNSSIKGIFVNIFGGIMKCDTVAAGIIEGAIEMKWKGATIVRFCGTNAEEGKKLLSMQSQMNSVIIEDDFERAAAIACSLTNMS